MFFSQIMCALQFSTILNKSRLIVGQWIAKGSYSWWGNVLPKDATDCGAIYCIRKLLTMEQYSNKEVTNNGAIYSQRKLLTVGQYTANGSYLQWGNTQPKEATDGWAYRAKGSYWQWGNIQPKEATDSGAIQSQRKLLTVGQHYKWPQSVTLIRLELAKTCGLCMVNISEKYFNFFLAIQDLEQTWNC